MEIIDHFYYYPHPFPDFEIQLTIASLSSCSQEEIAAIKLALKHKGELTHLPSIKEIKA